MVEHTAVAVLFQSCSKCNYNTIINEGLLDNAKSRLLSKLPKLIKKQFSFLGNNRGKGLMIGTSTDSNGNPGTEIASEVQGCIDKDC